MRMKQISENSEKLKIMYVRRGSLREVSIHGDAGDDTLQYMIHKPKSPEEVRERKKQKNILTYLLGFFLNGAELSLNSGNLRNH